MQDTKISRLLSGGLITNYNCPSYCGHCLYRCGPHRSTDYVDYETALSLFQTVREFGCHSAHIGGGEPLLRPDKLVAVLDAAGGVHAWAAAFSGGSRNRRGAMVFSLGPRPGAIPISIDMVIASS